MLIYQRVDTSQENGGLFTHQKSEICNRFALISYDFTRKNEELNIAQLAPELGIWWDLRDTDLVWEIPSMANSPAMAPAAKCPTRIIFLIFFASAFLSWNKREIGKSDFLETLDRPCFFFWGNYRGSCRFSIIDIYRPILGLVDHPWSSELRNEHQRQDVFTWNGLGKADGMGWRHRQSKVSSKVAEKACQWLGGLGFYIFLYVYWHGKPQMQRSPLPN